MAIANSDGSIILSLKISTQKAFQDFKGKIAQIAKQKKGFTLVELLTIICVIGLILGIAIPSTNKILRNAKESKFIADSICTLFFQIA